MADQKTLEMALDIITEGTVRGVRSQRVANSDMSGDEFQLESARRADEARDWTMGKGVQGFGIAPKITDGKRTDELALKIYVDRKRPLRTIENPAPKRVELPVLGEMVTDVEEIGEIKAQLHTTRADPMMPGCGLIHSETAGEVGTFGCIVHSNDRSDVNDYILSNAHVLANKGMADFDTVVIQPGFLDDGVVGTDDIGGLTSFIPFNFDPRRFLNTVDAAIARIDPNLRGTTRRIRIIDREPDGVSRSVRRGQRVQKVGRTTDHTWGEVLDTNFRVRLNYPNPARNGNIQRVGFKDQVLCTLFTAPGDSGAAVLSSTGKLVGLHFAGSPSRSVFNKIGNVFDQLDIRLPD